ncbi:MAG: hypothetical protein D6734_13190 [Candidatus Schekmanbacteria bacterium]|nr:MAG: hypothetical protein D6734_13190 [Candidatus Schekmanbacteria bacterium]
MKIFFEKICFNLSVFLFGTYFCIVLFSFKVFAETGFQPSPACATCHENKYMEWRASAMMLGMNDKIFKKLYEIAPDEKKKECLMCHSPAAFLNGDFGFKLLLSKENIPCDFCHTAKRIIKGGKFDFYEFEPGLMKRGTLKSPDTNLHEGVYSPLHDDSKFCSTCHQYRLKETLTIDTVYAEWLKSGYGNKGKHCQDCHMAPYSVKYDDMEETYYHHTFDGPMKIFFLIDEENKCVEFISKSIDIGAKIVKDKRKSEIKIDLTNSGIGHLLPGSAHGLRRLGLKVMAFNEKNKKVLEGEEILGVILANKNNEEVPFFWDAEKIKSDNRIFPNEKRGFTFISDSSVKSVVIRLVEHLIPKETAEILGIQEYEVLLKEYEFSQ